MLRPTFIRKKSCSTANQYLSMGFYLLYRVKLWPMYLHSSSPHPRRDLGGTHEGFQSNILKPCQQLFTFPSVRYKSGIKHIIYYTMNIYII